MLEGKNVNLRVTERDDVDFEVECFNEHGYVGGLFLDQLNPFENDELKEFIANHKLVKVDARAKCSRAIQLARKRMRKMKNREQKLQQSKA